ncbi:unnamed protein product [Aureobasidium mustum]|uniref:A-kinase anchor protein 7-like phosphoesterase domain-containing protein n=1 Tax=Aureobasidium mustum TaxID=2773714 RepID=A0A9N8JW88_9PEZI|nr:unnamed protein product [Aureobasidium mustum]
MTRHRKSKNKNAPKKPSLTHFLCVPLVNSVSQPQLEASIRGFKEHVCSTSPIEAAPGHDPTEVDRVSSETKTEGIISDASAQLEEQQRASEETALSGASSPLIPEKAIRPLGSLHLTLGVMSLDEQKLVQANTLLQSLDLSKMLHEATTPADSSDSTNINTQTSDVAPQSSSDTHPTQVPDLLSSPLKISLESLEPMQSPSKTSILYIRPQDPTNRLEILCQVIRKTFTDAGLLVPDTRPLKLHATIVNTIYVKGRKKKPKTPAQAKQSTIETPSKDQTTKERTSQVSTQHQGLQANEASSGHGPSAKSSLYLNATSLLSTYINHVWASDVPVEKITICEMGVKKQFSSTGEVIGEAYKEVAVKEVGAFMHIKEETTEE